MQFFISHSSKDKDYGDLLLQLLLDTGLYDNEIVYTSCVNNDIPIGENIFDWLKSKLVDKPFVFYLLSDNYYRSIPCLNEMGASWVIGSEHLTLITPSFNINNPNFTSGAIDPRKIVVFVNRRDDIIKLIDLVLSKTGRRLKISKVYSIVDKYFDSLSKIEHMSVEEVVETTEALDDSLHFDEFQKTIMNDLLTDEEMLLIKYMRDTGTYNLGDRWMAEGQVESIKDWERKRNLSDRLSDNYGKALNNFNIRGFLEEASHTSHGNCREYRLQSDIAKYILNLPLYLEERITKLMDFNKQHSSSFDFSNTDDDIPF